MKLWILLADETRARIFASAGRKQPLRELTALIHPKSRSKGREILTDRPGRVRTGLRGRALAALPPHTAPKEVEADRFAAEVADALRSGRERDEFDFLALVAPPRFLGRVRDKLAAKVRRRLVACVHKELTLTEARELPSHLSDVFDAVERAELAAPDGR